MNVQRISHEKSFQKSNVKNFSLNEIAQCKRWIMMIMISKGNEIDKYIT